MGTKKLPCSSGLHGSLFLYRLNPFRDSCGGGIEGGYAARFGLSVLIAPFSPSVHRFYRSVWMDGFRLVWVFLSDTGFQYSFPYVPVIFIAGAECLVISLGDPWFLASPLISLYRICAAVISGLKDQSVRALFPFSLWIAPACRCAWPMGIASLGSVGLSVDSSVFFSLSSLFACILPRMPRFVNCFLSYLENFFPYRKCFTEGRGS